MKMFYLDTSSSFLYTAVLEDDTIVDEIKERLDKDLSTLALPHINKMFERNNIKMEEIDKIIVVNGPGSFTGIRIGLTIAKTLSWAKRIPIIAISSLEAMALSCKQENMNYVVPAIDARRGFVFAAIFDKENNNFILKEQYISLNTLTAAIDNLPENLTFITNDNLDIIYKKTEYVPDILNIVNNVKNREAVNPHSVDANYLKLTEAEEKHDC